MQKFTKIQRVCTSLAALTLALSTMAAAQSVPGWYFHHSKDGVQPPIPSELAYVEQYDGYFIDRSHTDMNSDDKVLYLTFDAGYENGNVTKILDILKEENVPAAFFILEGLVKKEPELIKRMADEGHLLCNHTASHRDMTKVTDETEFRAELTKLEESCRAVTGADMAPYYRPPEGRISEQNMQFAQNAGYKTIFWSFAYADWDNSKQPDPQKTKERILSETHNGEVLLLHPTSAVNAAILQDLIRAWRDMGFRFGTLDELTGERA